MQPYGRLYRRVRPRSELALDALGNAIDGLAFAFPVQFLLPLDGRPPFVEIIGDTCRLAGKLFRFLGIGCGDKRTGFAFLTPPLIGETPDQIAGILVMRFAEFDERSRALAHRQRRRFQVGIVASDQRAQRLEVPRDPDPADRRRAFQSPPATRIMC